MKIKKDKEALLDHKKFLAEEFKEIWAKRRRSLLRIWICPTAMCAYFQRLIGTYQYLWLML